MKKFWNWMTEKDYAKECWSHIENKIIWRLKEIENHSYTKPTKQMLIGYMIEYFISKHPTMDITIGSSVANESIDKIYNYLENEINNT